jgi:hypothetical protein
MYEGPSAVLFENFLKHSSKVEPYCPRLSIANKMGFPERPKELELYPLEEN